MNKPKFFYSRNCQLCQYLAENININWDQWFDMICIDSKVIRDKITNSKNVRINKVPCILVSQVSDKNKTLIHKYEGEIVKQWIVQNIIKPLNDRKKNENDGEESNNEGDQSNGKEIKKGSNKREIRKGDESNKKSEGSNKKEIKKGEVKKGEELNKKEEKKPLKSNLKKTVKFDLPENGKDKVSFIDESEIHLLKNKKTLKEKLEPVKEEEQEEIEPLVEVVEKEIIGEEENPYIPKKKDVKGTSAVLEAAQRMRMERDESIKDENGKPPEDED